MVAQALPRAAGRKGWSFYLFLSLAANAYAAYAAGLGPVPSPPIDVPVLKISLSAVAAPPPARQAASAIAAMTPVEAPPMPVETVPDAPVGVAAPVEPPSAAACSSAMRWSGMTTCVVADCGAKVRTLEKSGALPVWTRGSVPLASLTFAEGLRLFGRQRGLALDDFLGRVDERSRALGLLLCPLDVPAKLL